MRSDQSETNSRWLWPIRLPNYVGETILRGALALNCRLGCWPNWAIVGIAVGVVPFFAAQLVGTGVVALFSAAALTILVVAAAARDHLVKGLVCIGAAYGAHSVFTISLAFWQPAVADQLYPDGATYWQKTLAWLDTGQSDEYEPRRWLVVHAVLIIGMALAAYPTLGLVPLFHAFHQLDLMNCYVGRLLAQSDRPLLTLLLGWHPWSLLRGLGFAVLIFEVVSLSLARLSGAPLSTKPRRMARWLAALFLLSADAALKYCCLDTIRSELAATLAGAH
ncbi:MAG: hypothetical protein HY040_02790 [Planctomycetes bacterium]|nr:hypothetical protein [Planctomycetota bacterium]